MVLAIVQNDQSAALMLWGVCCGLNIHVPAQAPLTSFETSLGCLQPNGISGPRQGFNLTLRTQCRFTTASHSALHVHGSNRNTGG